MSLKSSIFFTKPLSAPAGKAKITELASHKDLPFFAVGSGGKVLFYTEDGQLMPDLTYSRPLDCVKLAFHPIEAYLAIGWLEGTLTLRFISENQHWENGEAHRGKITVLDFFTCHSHDFLISGCEKGYVSVFEITNTVVEDRLRHKFDEKIKYIQAVDCTAFNMASDCPILLVGLEGGSIYMLHNDQVIHLYNVEDMVFFSHYISTVSSEHCIVSISESMHLNINSIEIHNDGESFDATSLTISNNSSARLAAQSVKCTSAFWLAPELFCTITNERHIRVWNIRNQEHFVFQLFNVTNTDHVVSLHYNDRKSMLFAGTNEGKLLIWKNSTGFKSVFTHWEEVACVSLKQEAEALGIDVDIGQVLQLTCFTTTNQTDAVVVRTPNISFMVLLNRRLVKKWIRGDNVLILYQLKSNLLQLQTNTDIRTSLEINGRLQHAALTDTALLCVTDSEMIHYMFSINSASLTLADPTHIEQGCSCAVLLESNTIAYANDSMLNLFSVDKMKVVFSLPLNRQDGQIAIMCAGTYEGLTRLAVLTNLGFFALFQFDSPSMTLTRLGSFNHDLIAVPFDIRFNKTLSLVSIFMSSYRSEDGLSDALMTVSTSPSLFVFDVTTSQLIDMCIDDPSRYIVDHVWDTVDERVIHVDTGATNVHSLQQDMRNNIMHATGQEEALVNADLDKLRNSLHRMKGTPASSMTTLQGASLDNESLAVLGLGSSYFFNRDIKTVSLSGNETAKTEVFTYFIVLGKAYFQDRFVPPLKTKDSMLFYGAVPSLFFISETKVRARPMRRRMVVGGAETSQREQVKSTDMVKLSLDSVYLKFFQSLASEPLNPTIIRLLLDFMHFISIKDVSKVRGLLSKPELKASKSLWFLLARICIKAKDLEILKFCLSHLKMSEVGYFSRFLQNYTTFYIADTTHLKTIQLGSIAVTLGFYDDALDIFKSVSAIDFYVLLLMMLNRFDEAIKFCKKNDRILLKSVLFRYSKLLFKQKRVEEAFKMLLESGFVELILPDIYASGDEELLNRVCEVLGKTTNVEVIIWLGMLKETIGDLSAALSYYERANDIEKQVRVLCRTKNFGLVEKILKDSGDRKGYYAYGKFLITYGESDLTRLDFESDDVIKPIETAVGNSERIPSLLENAHDLLLSPQAAGHSFQPDSLEMNSPIPVTPSITDKATDILQKNRRKAFECFIKAGVDSKALSLAIELGADAQEVFTLSLKSNSRLQRKAAQYFQENNELEKAVVLYSKAGFGERAATLCFKYDRLDLLESVGDISKNIRNLSGELADRLIQFYIEHGQKTKAATLLVQKQMLEEALELMVSKHVKMSEEMEEQMLQNPMLQSIPSDNSHQEQRSALLSSIALLCQRQGAFDKAAAYYTQAGDTMKALESLMRTGNIKKIMRFAKVSRDRKVYIKVASFLQLQDWQSDPSILKAIIKLFSKAKEWRRLCRFYVSCGGVEIDSYRNYEKGIKALIEGAKMLKKSDSSPPNMPWLIREIQAIKQFLTLKQHIINSTAGDPEAMMHVEELESLLMTIKSREIDVNLDDGPADLWNRNVLIHQGDLYGVLVYYYFRLEKNIPASLQLLKQMRQENIDIRQFINEEVVSEITTILQEQKRNAQAEVMVEEEEEPGTDVFTDTEEQRAPYLQNVVSELNVSVPSEYDIESHDPFDI
ncbi:hypothetical protein PCE1_000639 [Barthelona sp. PCE]